MKKFKKVISLLMMSAMLVLPTVLPVQAEEAENTNNDEVISTFAITNTAITKEAVHLRSEPSAYTGSVLATIPANTYIKIDYNNAVQGDGRWWFRCTYNGKTGYVIASSIQYIPGT